MRTIFSVDPSKRMADQAVPGHNRWHPDVPSVVAVNPGDTFRVECLDWTDGQIKNNDSANDIRDVDLTAVHMLSGPFEVNGAAPGDLLCVDILDVQPLNTAGAPHPWGFTGVFAKTNGGSFLTDYFPNAYKACWDFSGIYATTRHIPALKFIGIKHSGLMGTAPTQELLNEWNRREKALVDRDPNRVPPLANLPTSHSALAGTARGADAQRICTEGARTVPPREHGGNHDIKNLTLGARICFPVYVKGAKLSVGDLHFSQGDGEITFCGAIEMAGALELHVDLIKDGVNKYGVVNPVSQVGPLYPHYGEYLVFEGISVDERTGEQHYLNSFLAYQRACLNAIHYLTKFGYTPEQAYVIVGTAPAEGRLSGVVDIPNACSSLYIPTDIFGFDVRPSAAGPTKSVPSSQVAVTS